MKTGFLITARLKSSRLPLKLLKDLAGKTVIERVIDRVKYVAGIDEIILCTSTNSQDLPLVDAARKCGIYYYTGHEIDVLQRLLDAATFFQLDAFLSITADNPLFSIDHAHIIIAKLQNSPIDFVRCQGLPLGTAPMGIYKKALEVVCKIKDVADTEIWGSLLNQPAVFTVETINAAAAYEGSENFRLTLDYPEDYQLINHLYSRIRFSTVVNLIEVIHFLKRNPEIAKWNRHCVQKQMEPSEAQRIQKFFIDNKTRIIDIKKQIYSRG